MSQRFNTDNEDIRYSRKGVDKDGIEVYETSEDTKTSRKIPDPYTSRELLAKALTKVAKGEEKVLLEQYKSNLRMIEGEMGNLKNLRKEIDAIKYKKSITYKGENLSVKEFEQIAYTRAEERGSM